VILQTRLGVEAGEVHFAGRHQEMAMDEVHLKRKLGSFPAKWRTPLTWPFPGPCKRRVDR
jgi:hypothetical protein